MSGAAPAQDPAAAATTPAAPTAAAAAGHARVLVIGAGFGGLEVARALGRAGVETLIVDRRNHHLFQPLLYQVATAALAAPDIAVPIRRILRGSRSVEVQLDEATAIDWRAKAVDFASGARIGYDVLVLAAGAETFYFGHEDWAEHAPGLKSIDDAWAIRSRLLAAFERAERTTDPAARARLMTLAVIGGGPTGVEMAGSIAELSRHTLARDFRNIRPEATRVLLIEAGPRLLPAFSADSAAFALARLERLGVEVRLGCAVDAIDAEEIRLGDERLPVGLVVWGAGVAASALARALDAETDKGGRIVVDRTLAVPERPGVYALGDLARAPGPGGEPLPGLAQVARQQGIHLGRALAAALASGAPIPPFEYASRGNTAIIGRNAAVFETDRFRIEGWPAWALWALIHVYLLVGFPQRVVVSIRWLWRYLTYERGARLITTSEIEPRRGLEAPATAVDDRDA